MARSKKTLTNINNNDPANYLEGRIKDNTGAGDGTPVNEFVYGDIHQYHAKLMHLAGITYNNLPDNETNGYQLIEATQALAGKNDFVYNISSTSGGILTIPVKLGRLQNNEVLLCKATVNQIANQPQIKGTLDNVTKSITTVGTFKPGEYVRLINTPTNVILVRLVDLVNLDTAVSELFYLKKATQAQEDAGTLDTAATTPKVNKSTFATRVNGTQSGSYLATPSRNGLLSKEDKKIIDDLNEVPNTLRNRGWFSGLDVGNTPAFTLLPTSGDILSAQVGLSGFDGTRTSVKVTFAHPMDNLNYLVRICVENLNDRSFSVVSASNNITSTTEIQVIVSDSRNADFDTEVQNLKIHIEAIQL